MFYKSIQIHVDCDEKRMATHTCFEAIRQMLFLALQRYWRERD